MAYRNLAFPFLLMELRRRADQVQRFEDVQWSNQNITVTDEDAQALHQALTPLLTALFLAGHNVTSVFVVKSSSELTAPLYFQPQTRFRDPSSGAGGDDRTVYDTHYTTMVGSGSAVVLVLEDVAFLDNGATPMTLPASGTDWELRGSGALLAVGFASGTTMMEIAGKAADAVALVAKAVVDELATNTTVGATWSAAGLLDIYDPSQWTPTDNKPAGKSLERIGSLIFDSFKDDATKLTAFLEREVGFRPIDPDNPSNPTDPPVPLVQLVEQLIEESPSLKPRRPGRYVRPFMNRLKRVMRKRFAQLDRPFTMQDYSELTWTEALLEAEKYGLMGTKPLGAPPARLWLRFPLTEAAQNDLATTPAPAATDILFDDASVDTDDHLEFQGVKLTGEMTAGSDPPELMPLCEGTLYFITSGTFSQLPANHQAVTQANYASWPTGGTLLLVIHPERYVELAEEHTPALVARAEAATDPLGDDVNLLPNRVWYGGIKITEEFLFQTIANKVRRTYIPGTSISGSNPDWAAHAIRHFLRGEFGVRIDMSLVSASDDDAVHYDMPVVELDSNNAFELTICTAFTDHAQDIDEYRGSFTFPSHLSGVLKQEDYERRLPKHLSNGRIPATMIFRQLRSYMIDADAGFAMADAWLPAWGAGGPRYAMAWVTRTARLVHNVSGWFPEQKVLFKSKNNGYTLYQGNVPAHGRIYMRIDAPGTPLDAADDDVELHVAWTNMTWIKGGEADWDTAGTRGSAANHFEFASAHGTNEFMHLSVRAPMWHDMFVEDAHGAKGITCTYQTLRRSIRAHCDNRITGGAMNRGERRSMDLVFDRRPQFPMPLGTLLSAIIQGLWTELASGKPPQLNGWSPAGSAGANQPAINRANTQLHDILHMIYPMRAVPQGAMPAKFRSKGWVAYALWMSYKDSPGGSDRNYFYDAHVGRGSCGAAEYLGWAVPDTMTTPTEMWESQDRTIPDWPPPPGSLIQWWHRSHFYNRLRNRQTIPNPIPNGESEYNYAKGHSMIYVRHETNPPQPANLVGAIDQHTTYGVSSDNTPEQQSVTKMPWNGAGGLWCYGGNNEIYLLSTWVDE